MSLPNLPLHWVATMLLGATLALASFLAIGLRFDPSDSPVWQFGPYLLMLAFLLVATSALGMLPAFLWLGRLRCILPLLVFLILGALVTWGWMQSGPYNGFRDARLFPTVLRASAASVMVIGVLGLSQAVFMFILFLGYQKGWPWVSRLPWSYRFLPSGRLSDTDRLGEGSISYDRADQ